MEVAELHRKHLGGQLLFSPDGLLHIILGDGMITLDDMEEMDGLRWDKASHISSFSVSPPGVVPAIVKVLFLSVCLNAVISQGPSSGSTWTRTAARPLIQYRRTTRTLTAPTSLPKSLRTDYMTQAGECKISTAPLRHRTWTWRREDTLKSHLVLPLQVCGWPASLRQWKLPDPLHRREW